MNALTIVLLSVYLAGILAAWALLFYTAKAAWKDYLFRQFVGEGLSAFVWPMMLLAIIVAAAWEQITKKMGKKVK